MNLADEVLDHLFRDLEIGDDAVAHRADRLDVAGRAAQHHLGVVADGADLLLAAAVVIVATTEGSFRTMPRPLT